MTENDSSEYTFQGSGLAGKEKNWAKKRFEEYRANYSIGDYSDLQLLEEVIFKEALIERYKQKIEGLTKQVTKKKKDSETAENIGKDVIPKHLINSISELTDQIMNIKDKLGLIDRDVDEKRIEKQKEKKFELWLEQNQACRETKCEHCGKMLLLTIRVDKYDARKFPFFMDKYLFNKESWRCYWLGKITKLELTRILVGREATLTDYIDWVEDKLEKNPVFLKFKKRIMAEKNA